MGGKAKRISHLLLEPQEQSQIRPNECSTLPNMISPHFTIRVTEFNQNGTSNISYSNGKSVSTNTLELDKRRAPHSPQDTDQDENSLTTVNGSSSMKKKIKMSEEVPSKRVILVLPNGSSPISRPNSHNKKYIPTSNDHSETNSKNYSTEAKVNQGMMDSSTKLNGGNGFDEMKLATLNLNMETNTDEGFHETPIPTETLTDDVKGTRDARGVSTPSPKRSKISSGISNNDSIEDFGLTTSTPKLPRSSLSTRQIVRKRKLSKSNILESQTESSIKKLTHSMGGSSNSAESKQSVDIFTEIPMTKCDTVIPPQPVLSPSSTLRKSINHSDSSNSSFRKIKINGLTLRAIDPSILENSTLREKIKILTRSQSDKISSNVVKVVDAEKTLENGMASAAKSPQEIYRTELNCENCKRLQSEVNMQHHIISNLKSNLMKLTVEMNDRLLLDSKSDKRVDEMQNINRQLEENLQQERIYNNKLKTDIVNRDKHIKTLERELTHVSQIFGEMERKSVSLKKLIHNSVTPQADNEFSDFVSVDYSDVDSCQ